MASFSRRFLAPLLVHAQSATMWLHHAWQADDWIPTHDVTAVAQRPHSTMLFAPPRGLARFDGRPMRELDTGNPLLAGPSIRGILSARPGYDPSLLESAEIALRYIAFSVDILDPTRPPIQKPTRTP